MAFNKRLDSIFPGMGQPLRNDSVFQATGIAVATTGSPLTTTFPLNSVLIAPATSAGRMRLKFYNGATSPVLTTIQVSASDGTNRVQIPQGYFSNGTIVLSATSWVEFEFEYILDVAAGVGLGGGSIGQLLSSVGGATSFNIITTFTGAGGTALMDVELCPLI